MAEWLRAKWAIVEAMPVDLGIASGCPGRILTRGQCAASCRSRSYEACPTLPSLRQPNDSQLTVPSQTPIRRLVRGRSVPRTCRGPII